MRRFAMSAAALCALAISACSDKTEQAASNTLESARDDIATQAAPVVSGAARDVGNAVGTAATDAAGAVGSAANDLNRKLKDRPTTASPGPVPSTTPTPQ